MQNNNLEEAAALIKKADQFIKGNRGLANAIRDESRNPVVKLFAIVEFQNQALERLLAAIRTKDAN